MGRFRTRMVKSLGLPQESALMVPRVVILPGEVYVENHTGIEEYDNECVCVRQNGQLLRVAGRGLTLGYMKRDTIKISGEICRIAFERQMT